MRNKKGFTIIELLVAMAIIGLLIGLTIFGVTRAFRTSRDTKRQNLARELQTAIVAYEGKYRKLPDYLVSDEAADSTVYVSDTNTGASSKKIEFEYDMEVVVVGADQDYADDATNTAYVCYDKQTSGYAVGVKLEDGGEWYYMTTNTCF